jgi:hypothetical protein
MGHKIEDNTRKITMEQTEHKHTKHDERISGASTDTTMNELKERVKELNCFYRITNIVKNSKLSTDEALQQIVEEMPPAWQYPQATCSQIALHGGKKFRTPNFQETEWVLLSNIVVDDKKIGSLEVYYLEQKPPTDEGPFLIEERRLIDAVADLIGQFIEERHVKEELKHQRKKLDTAEKGKAAAEKELSSKGETTEKKYDWEVIIDLLTKTDPRTLLRITRKMMYYLFRIENEKIINLLSKLTPVDKDSDAVEWRGINMPNIRQDLETFYSIQKQVFEIAKESIPSDVISNLFANWMKQDKARPLLLTSQKTGIPLV